MKKLLFSLLLLPFLSSAQDKNVITIDRYFPKADKVSQFEKALAAHAQKFHKGDVQWRVYTVETGPDAGAYHVVEGPTSWDALDNRGDISKAHTDDWNMNVQPLLSDRAAQTGYLTFRQDLSTAIQTDYSDKISVLHLFQNPGYRGDVENLIKDMKKAWTDNGDFVAVYEASSSGEPQFAIVTRYKNGLKDRVAINRQSMQSIFAKAGDQSSWNRYIENYKQSVNHQWSEMLFFKPELGSK